MAMNKIIVISWNINGIQNLVKRFELLSHLESLDCDIALLQESFQRRVFQVKTTLGGTNFFLLQVQPP